MGSQNFDRREQTLLTTLLKSGLSFYAWVGLLGALFLTGVYAYIQQLREGLGVTAMRDYVSWGLYITNFVFFIGISHVGALMSAILRITGAGWRKPITRMAEAITFSSLFFGALMPIIDLGRPDRILNMFLYPRIQSPIIWDFVCIFTYLTGSTIFLFLPMIPDIAILRDLASIKGLRHRLYSLLSLGWRGTPDQHHRLEKAMAVMAILIIPIAVSVHTVVSWIFGMTLRPGWNSTIFGPYFVMGALVSGAASVVIAMAAFRKFYHLEEYITVKHFRNMALLTTVLALIYIYFNIAEYLTLGYKMEGAEAGLLYSLLGGEYALAFWLVQIGGLFLPVLLFLLPEIKVVGVIRRIPMVRPLPLAVATLASFGVVMLSGRGPTLLSLGDFGDPLSWVLLGIAGLFLFSLLPLLQEHRIAAYFLGAGLIVTQAWFKRYLVVVPTLLNPYLPIQDARVEWTTYIPTGVEWAITIGAIAGFVLLYTLFSKVFPIVSIWETREEKPVPPVGQSASAPLYPSPLRREIKWGIGGLPRALMLLILGILLGLTLTAALIFAPKAGAQSFLQDPPPPDAEELYAENCASCHGEKGEGRGGPALTHLSDHSDDEIYHVISEGRSQKGMPAWEGRLTSEEITALVGYLRTFGAPSRTSEGEHETPHAEGSISLVLTLEGDEVVASARLSGADGKPLSGEEVAFALRTTLGGKLSLGNFATDENGTATMRYPVGEVPNLTFEASFPAGGENPAVAVAKIEIPANQEIPPVPTGFYSPNPPLVAIALLALVIGGVWLTYAWVGYQLLRIWKGN